MENAQLYWFNKDFYVVINTVWTNVQHHSIISTASTKDTSIR